MSKQRSAYWIHRDHLFRKDEYLCSACKYRAEKARTFEYTPDTKCPYCGQELPIASVEGARKKAEEIFIAERKAAVEKIIAAA